MTEPLDAGEQRFKPLVEAVFKLWRDADASRLASPPEVFGFHGRFKIRRKQKLSIFHFDVFSLATVATVSRDCTPMRPPVDAALRHRTRGVSLPPDIETQALKRAGQLDMSFSRYVQHLIALDLRRGIISSAGRRLKATSRIIIMFMLTFLPANCPAFPLAAADQAAPSFLVVPLLQLRDQRTSSKLNDSTQTKP